MMVQVHRSKSTGGLSICKKAFKIIAIVGFITISIVYYFHPSDIDTSVHGVSIKEEQQELISANDIVNDPTDGDGDGDGEGNAKNEVILGKEAIVRTTMGDIRIQLFPEDTPKTVENFSGHARSGYYENVIFHRVIKGFMIQTGDPRGNGTGGKSIWGGEFEDEFVKSLRHDRKFTVSMANAGPNTNGSQFFITTVPCPWLDDMHTVFGRVTKGMDVVTKIESVKVNKMDKPYEEVSILSVDIIS